MKQKTIHNSCSKRSKKRRSWRKIVDFTKIQKGGVKIASLLEKL